jgi:hypothetical protein
VPLPAYINRRRHGLTAAAGPPFLPPRAWFKQPEPGELTGLTVTTEGQVYGHAAAWGTCHIGKPGRCVTPPKSRSSYAYFKTGLTELQEGGTVATGRVTLGTGHAALSASPAAAQEHYDNSGAVVADVVARDGVHGIWVAGALRPSVTPARLRELRGASLSGDWRSIGGALEMIGLLAVNIPGFPVPRSEMELTAAGNTLALVAAGVEGAAPDISDEAFSAELAMGAAAIALLTEPWG